MKSLLLQLPEERTEKVAWLERALFSTALPQLVAELQAVAVHRSNPPRLTLGEVLGASGDAVLDGGLNYLPPNALGQLLRQPELLIELRDLALVAGGDYWNNVASSPELEQIAERVIRHLKLTMQTRTPSPRRSWAMPVAATATLAASLLLGLMLTGNLTWRDSASNWGFSQVQQIKSQTPREYFEALAKLADQWHNKPTPDAIALAKRLTEFRQGCAALQLARHASLNDDDTRWLKLRCADWANEIEQHLRELEETGRADVVQAKAASTVKNLAEELRNRRTS